MSKFRIIIAATLALFFSVSCNGVEKNEKTMENKGKALVVFFSHAGDNYAVGNIEVGNTKIVANYISEIAGADQFEIVTHKSKSATCHNMTPSSLVVPCGGAPIHR